MFKFEGRTAVISGGAEGIGLSIAKALGEQKMNIVLADIDEKNLLKSTAELESLGIPVLAALLDVADEMQWKSVAEKAIDKVIQSEGKEVSLEGLIKLALKNC